MHIVILMTNYIHAKKVIKNIPRNRQVLRSNSEVFWYPESWKKTKPDKFKLSKFILATFENLHSIHNSIYRSENSKSKFLAIQSHHYSHIAIKGDKCKICNQGLWNLENSRYLKCRWGMPICLPPNVTDEGPVFY